MKKLHHLLTALVFLTASLFAQSQPSKQAIHQRNESHLAKFSVYDFTTKAPIANAVVTNQQGQELGFTDDKGDLSLEVPQNTMEFYTIKAEGFNQMKIRLTQAERKTGKYEVFLPSMEIGYTQASVNASDMPINEQKEEMVKVYVRQDPALYQKKSNQSPVTFSVQVYASSNTISESTAKKEWNDVGQVYIQKENGMYKVRIGPYATQVEAKQILGAVKSKGRKDAFIVVNQSGELDAPVVTTEVKETPAPVIEEKEFSLAVGDYKVRVASYLHPGTFNPDGIDQLGRLESYRRGEWTIMMIGGFKTLDDAKRAKNIVSSKGFTDAAIVLEKDGILETVEE
ncbi:MAG TPA: SPOR domain-containing protein [Saprospiraceae bacterium]|nr:SPOR domain-containing protein [Saprospiraceae bacterium]